MIKLHLGCGPHVFPGWHNYDLDPGPGGIKRDLTQRLPWGTESVDFIYSEHFIEHITRAQAVALLTECRRVLKPAGVLRLVTPSLQHLLQRYISNDLFKLSGVWEPETGCQMVNEGMRLWGHQFLYDGQELGLVLEEAGFEGHARANYGVSAWPELEGIEVRPPNKDLIVEAFP